MIHPHTTVVKVSVDVGLGVVVDRPIPRGTIVWAQDRLDRVFSPTELDGLDEGHRAILDRFAHLDRHGRRILCWDAGRLVNHACDPTLRGIGPTIMVARRDLWPGDEITCDYAECNLDEPLACRCGSPECRGWIYGDDLLKLGTRWDGEVQVLLAAARDLPQPVLPFAVERDQFEAWLAERAPVPPFASQCAVFEGVP